MNKKILPRKEYLKTLPKKRMGSGMIFLNDKNEILFLKTNYKDYLIIPGGVVEKNESPWEAAERETLEEIGLDKKAKRLLIVDYISTKNGEDENLQWLFFGGKLSEEEINNIVLQADEIISYKFLNPNNADSELNSKLIMRKKYILDAIENNKTYFLEDGQSVT